MRRRELTPREEELRAVAGSATYDRLQDEAIKALAILRSKTRKSHKKARTDAAIILERALGHR